MRQRVIDEGVGDISNQGLRASRPAASTSQGATNRVRAESEPESLRPARSSQEGARRTLAHNTSVYTIR